MSRLVSSFTRDVSVITVWGLIDLYYFKLCNIEQKWSVQEPQNWQAGQYL
ncbi:hypothetical protein [Peribacillus sp. Bi96]|nr:hypothetical protein [Peribacillus sp. Bi96]